MTSYKDLAGREWPCRMTFGTTERIREKFGIDMFAMLVDAEASHETVEAVFTNPMRTLQVLWECVPDEARKDVSFAAFADAVDGTVLDAAVPCLVRAMTGMFSDPTQRDARARMLLRTLNLNAQMELACAEKMEQVTPDYRRLLDENVPAAGSGQAPAA